MSDNYPFDLSGRPGEVSKGWMNALSGGALTMQKLSVAAGGFEIQKLASYRLDDSSFTPLGYPFNPSVTCVGDCLLVNIRVAKEDLQTHNFIGRLEGGELKELSRLEDKSGVGPLQNGFEDLRIFQLHGGVYAIASTATPTTVGYPHNRQTVLKLEVNGGQWAITKAWPLHSSKHEKNWMPVVADGKVLKFVYSTDPLVWLDFDGGGVSPGPDAVKVPAGTLRGGSQLVPWQNGWLALVHQVHLAGDAAKGAPAKGVYLHRFAYFENGVATVRLSEPFYFQGRQIEFAAGLAFFQGKWFVSYGVEDREAWVSELTPEVVEGLFK